jgi:uncharacterized membrane protein (UPF0136 family)
VPISDIVGVLIRRVAGRIIRRSIAGAICLIFALGALYHLTAAADLALEIRFGALPARLAIGGAYALVASVVALVLWATRAKLASSRRDGLSNSPRDLQIAMIVESVLLGLALARGVSPRKPTPPPEDAPPA